MCDDCNDYIDYRYVKALYTTKLFWVWGKQRIRGKENDREGEGYIPQKPEATSQERKTNQLNLEKEPT